MPFAVQSPDTALSSLGYGVAELLADDLSRSHEVLVLERMRIADIERERAFQSATALDGAPRDTLATLLGAQHIIIGNITAASDTGRSTMQAQSVSVESGAVELRRAASGALADIFRIEHDLALATFAAYGITLTPSEKRALDERVPASLEGFVAFSRGVRAESRHDDAAAAHSYEQAVKLDRSFKLAQTRLASAVARISAKSGSSSTKTGATNSATNSAHDDAKADASRKVPIKKGMTTRVRRRLTPTLPVR
jgi:TolB-like protein